MDLFGLIFWPLGSYLAHFSGYCINLVYFNDQKCFKLWGKFGPSFDLFLDIPWTRFGPFLDQQNLNLTHPIILPADNYAE